MKPLLRIFAICVLVSAVSFWAAKGGNRGWTINNLAHGSVNPVTGLTVTTYEKVFIPGLDFIVLAVCGAAGLTGLSFLFSRKKSGNKTPQPESIPCNKT